MQPFLKLFFHLLYHQFAIAYDLVAWLVSFGNWNNWVLEVVPFLKGTRTLEIGHGPGHLQRFLLNQGLVTVAMDESAPMGRLAKYNLTKNHLYNSQNGLSKNAASHLDYAQINLARGIAQQLPFCDDAFDTIFATFPAEYISDERTLSEVRRCLSDRGRFVVLPVALPKNWLLSWLFKVTGQSPSDALQIILEKLEEPFIQSEFSVETQVIEKPSGSLIIIIATRKETNIYAQKTS